MIYRSTTRRTSLNGSRRPFGVSAEDIATIVEAAKPIAEGAISAAGRKSAPKKRRKAKERPAPTVEAPPTVPWGPLALGASALVAAVVLLRPGRPSTPAPASAPRQNPRRRRRRRRGRR